jgi:hypothetical protein
MISCITFKNSTFKQFKIKNVDEENIYKKCGYKSSNNVNKLYVWKVDDSKELELWCKVDSVCKMYSQHNLFLKYSINVNSNNKCIFLLKNNKEYINLDSKFFNEFFNLKEVIETGSNNDDETDSSKTKNIKGQSANNGTTNDSTTNTNTNTNDSTTNNSTNTNTSTNISTNDISDALRSMDTNLNKNEDYEVNSELSYELYSYSDDEE